ITDVLETTQYVQMLEELDREEAEERLQNIDELITKVVSFEMAREELGEEVTLSAFLEEVALVADIDGVDKDDNKVLLMTIHSAKGLEFSHVYLAGMEDGVFPSYMTITSDDPMDIEEERRLAYVGITRAKEDLTISYAKARMLRGETQYNPVSRFVKEIPPELMDNKLPSIRKWDQNAYETDSYERSHFKAKPFQTGMPQNSFGGRGQQKVQLSDTVFDKPKNNWAAAETVRNNWESSTINTSYQKTTGVTKTKQVKDLSEIIGSRPKAVVKKKETPSANKPYIAKSLDGLSKGVPTTSGGLGYQAGDRVQHIKYGEGTVLKIEQDTRDYKVTVAFDEAGNKIMYAAFAKLRKI
ncbi:MAG: ATP-binding domain-containing protein, partial [Lachnospiraceae bacterium]|nr:ATP-binding domain-containing protein [Lachnospiraceae bacterium]